MEHDEVLGEGWIARREMDVQCPKAWGRAQNAADFPDRGVYFEVEERSSAEFAASGDELPMLSNQGFPVLSDRTSSTVSGLISADQLNFTVIVLMHLQVYLAVVWHAGILGAAIYDSEAALVSLLMDIADTPPGFEILHTRELKIALKAVCTSFWGANNFFAGVSSTMRF